MNLLKQLIIGLVAIAVAVVGWAFFVPSAAPYLERFGVYETLGIAAPTTEGGRAGRRGFGGGTARVVVSAATEGQVNARVTAIGDGRSARSVTVRGDASGIIRDLRVLAGSYVEEGALLLQLDDAAEQIALERARLLFSDASADLERLQQLDGSGTITAVQLRNSSLALRTAELQVKQAEFDLEQRRVTAPISGWVGLLEVEQGDRITAQEAIAVITDRSQIRIDFRVPERVIGDLSIGMPLEVVALARPDQVLRGEIVALDNIVDPASRTLRVQGQLDNTDDSLRAGQAYSVVLSLPGETLPSVDPLAIQWSGDGAFVWLVREGKAQRVPITIRQRNNDSVLVEGAVEPGAQIIVEGVQTLRPGSEVEVVSGVARQSSAVTDSPVPRRKI